jgi:hypothetical protein
MHLRRIDRIRCTSGCITCFSVPIAKMFIDSVARAQPPCLVAAREFVVRQLNRRKYAHFGCAERLEQRAVPEFTCEPWLDSIAIEALIDLSACGSVTCRQQNRDVRQ